MFLLQEKKIGPLELCFSFLFILVSAPIVETMVGLLNQNTECEFDQNDFRFLAGG